MRKNLFKLSTLAFLLLFAFVGCKKNDTMKGKVAIQFKANSGARTAAPERANAPLVFDGGLEVSSFKLNITEIEFDLADDDELVAEYNGTFSSDDEVELRGPFEVDLLLDGELQTQTLLNNLDIPMAKYEEIEFDLEKSKNSNSLLNGLSVRIEGKINGVPFVFSSDKEFDFEIEFDQPFSPGDNAGVVINFYVNSFFQAIVANYDLTQATPNADGIIVITYNENDNKTNNYQLGKVIWELMDDMFDCDDYDNDFDDNDDDDDN